MAKFGCFWAKKLNINRDKAKLFPEKQCLSPKIALERLKLLSHTSAKPNVWMPTLSVITFSFLKISEMQIFGLARTQEY